MTFTQVRNIFKFKDFIILLVLFKIYLQMIFLYSMTDLYILWYTIVGLFYLIFVIFITVGYYLLILNIHLFRFNFVNYCCSFFRYIKNDTNKFSVLIFCFAKLFILAFLIITYFYFYNTILSCEVFKSNNFYQELTIIFFVLTIYMLKF